MWRLFIEESAVGTTRTGTPTQGEIAGFPQHSRTEGPKLKVMPAGTLTGSAVRNHIGEDLGTIRHVIIDVANGRFAYAVLSFGGLFGIGRKLFAIPWTALGLDAENKCFVLSTSKERLRRTEGLDKNWSKIADPRWALDLHNFYCARPYWHDPSQHIPRRKTLIAERLARKYDSDRASAIEHRGYYTMAQEKIRSGSHSR